MTSTLLFFAVICCLEGLHVCDIIPDELKAGGKFGNPGMHLRLNHRAIHYIVDVAARILTDEIPNLRIRKIEQDVGNDRGKVTLTNVKVISFKPPEKYWVDLIAPDKLKVSIRSVDLTTNADFKGDIHLDNSSYGATGKVNTTTTGVDQDFTTRIVKGADGRPHLKTHECITHIDKLTMDMDILGSGAELLQNFKESVEEKAKAILEKKMCQLLTGQIETDLDKQLARLGDVVPIRNLDSRTTDDENDNDSDTPKSPVVGKKPPNEADKNTKRRDGVSPPVGPRLSRFFDIQNLSLDARLNRDPFVSEDWIETFHKGEISWKGRGGTPFYPADLPAQLGVSDNDNDVRMVYVQISDYLINSLLYSAYKNGNTTLVANDVNTPDLRNFLRTKCGSEPDCFGNIFPSTVKAYPDHKIEILAPANAPPYIIMSKVSPGSKVHLRTNVIVTAISPKAPFTRTKLCSTDAVLLADGHFLMIGSRLTASIEVKSVVIKTPTTGPFVHESPETFVKFGTFLASVISNRINEDLQRGVKLPILKYATLYDPQVVSFDRSLLVRTDFQLNEDKLRQTAHDSIMKALETFTQGHNKTSKTTGTKATVKPGRRFH